MNANQAAALSAALGGIPVLPGAACKGYSRVFDEPPAPSVDPDPGATAERIAFALRACQECPALGLCRQWVASLPANQRPPGVVAGEIRLPKSRDRPPDEPRCGRTSAAGRPCRLRVARAGQSCEWHRGAAR